MGRTLSSLLLWSLAASAGAVSYFAQVRTVPEQVELEQAFAVLVSVYHDNEVDWANFTSVVSSAGNLVELAFEPPPSGTRPIIVRTDFLVGPIAGRTAEEGVNPDGSFSVVLRGENAWAALPDDVAARGDFIALPPGRGQPLLPEGGVYWDPDDPGTGYAVDVQDGFVFLVRYAYDADGQPAWDTAQGALEGSVLETELLRTTQGEDGPVTEALGAATIIFQGRSTVWFQTAGERTFRKLTRFRTRSPELIRADDSPYLSGSIQVPDLEGRWLEILDDPLSGRSSRVVSFSRYASFGEDPLAPPGFRFDGTGVSLICSPQLVSFEPGDEPAIVDTIPVYSDYFCDIGGNQGLDIDVRLRLDQTGVERLEFTPDADGVRRTLIRYP